MVAAWLGESILLDFMFKVDMPLVKRLNMMGSRELRATANLVLFLGDES